MKQLQLKPRVCLVWVLSSGPPSSSFAVNSTLDFLESRCEQLFLGRRRKAVTWMLGSLANHGRPDWWTHTSVAPGRVGPKGSGSIAGCTGAGCSPILHHEAAPTGVGNRMCNSRPSSDRPYRKASTAKRRQGCSKSFACFGVTHRDYETDASILGAQPRTRNVCPALSPRLIQAQAPSTHSIYCVARMLSPTGGGRFHEVNSRSVQQRDSAGPLFSRIFHVFPYSLPLPKKVEVEGEVRCLAFWISTCHRKMWGHSTLVAADNWRRDWPNLKIEVKRGRLPMEPDLEAGPESGICGRLFDINNPTLGFATTRFDPASQKYPTRAADQTLLRDREILETELPT